MLKFLALARPDPALLISKIHFRFAIEARKYKINKKRPIYLFNDHKKTRNQKKFLSFFIALIASGSSTAWAECTIRQTDGAVVPYLRVVLPAWNPPPFDPTVPVGTVLFRGVGGGSGLGGIVRCSDVLGTGTYTGTGPVGKYSTYETGISGVGVRIRGGINVNDWWPQKGYWNVKENDYVPASEITIELVKTGPITAAGSMTGEIGRTTLVDQNLVVRRVFINGSLNIQPLVPTCKVTTPSIAVSMGKVMTKTLTGVGTTTSARPFNIQLRCSGGTSGSTTRMYTTLTDASNPANVSNMLSLGPDSTASGVSIQVLHGDNDKLISYGPDSSQAGNPNQWFVGEFGNVDVTIPLKARYVQTASDVKAGTANGRATFTMSYQ